MFSMFSIDIPKLQLDLKRGDHTSVHIPINTRTLQCIVQVSKPYVPGEGLTQVLATGSHSFGLDPIRHHPKETRSEISMFPPSMQRLMDSAVIPAPATGRRRRLTDGGGGGRSRRASSQASRTRKLAIEGGGVTSAPLASLPPPPPPPVSVRRTRAALGWWAAKASRTRSNASRLLAASSALTFASWSSRRRIAPGLLAAVSGARNANSQ